MITFYTSKKPSQIISNIHIVYCSGLQLLAGFPVLQQLRWDIIQPWFIKSCFSLLWFGGAVCKRCHQLCYYLHTNAEEHSKCLSETLIVWLVTGLTIFSISEAAGLTALLKMLCWSTISACTVVFSGQSSAHRHAHT